LIAKVALLILGLISSTVPSPSDELGSAGLPVPAGTNKTAAARGLHPFHFPALIKVKHNA